MSSDVIFFTKVSGQEYFHHQLAWRGFRVVRRAHLVEGIKHMMYSRGGVTNMYQGHTLEGRRAAVNWLISKVTAGNVKLFIIP